MSVLDTLIYDRTQADVNRVAALSKIKYSDMTAAELAEYLTNMKGAYNYSDWNRIGLAIKYVIEQLAKSDINITATIKTDWAQTDIPNKAQAQNIIDAINQCRNSVPVPDDVPTTPTTMANMTYRKANDLEKILYELGKIAENITKSINLGWALGIADIGLYGGLA